MGQVFVSVKPLRSKVNTEMVSDIKRLILSVVLSKFVGFFTLSWWYFYFYHASKTCRLNTSLFSNSSFFWSATWLQPPTTEVTSGTVKARVLRHARRSERWLTRRERKKNLKVWDWGSGNLDRMVGWKSRHRKRQWDERNSPCSIPPTGRRLQASLNVRVWTTAWAGWGRKHTSPLTRKTPQHQTGFSSRLELLSTCQATTGKRRGCLNSHLGGIFLMSTKSQCSSIESFLCKIHAFFFFALF